MNQWGNGFAPLNQGLHHSMVVMQIYVQNLLPPKKTDGTEFWLKCMNSDCCFGQNHHVKKYLWYRENMNTVHCFEHNCTEPTYKLWKVNSFLISYTKMKLTKHGRRIHYLIWLLQGTTQKYLLNTGFHCTQLTISCT
jgi:hypothetical protein